MNKISKLLKALSLIIKQPSLLNKIIDDNDVNKADVIKKHNLPLGLKTIEITDLLPNFNETVEPFCFLDGGSTPIDLALLKGLARKYSECNYFEIGTWLGESVTNVSTVAKNCTTLNLPDNEMLKMGADKNYIDLHRFFSKNIPNINHLQANSLTFDYNSLHQKFDLIFIDGDHHYESVKSDTQNAFKLLLRDERSIIVWHDYKSTTNSIRWDVLKGILEGTPIEKQNQLYHVSNTLCAIYLTQPIESSYMQPYSKPKKYFSINLKAVSTRL